MIDKKGYRPNVGIILTNREGKLLWARRIHQDAWQFPQGGIRPKETPQEAMYRELEEEITLLWDGSRPGKTLEEFIAQWQALAEPLETEKQAALRYPGLKEQRAAIIGAREAFATEFEAAQHIQTRMKILIDLWPAWEPVREKRKALSSLPPIDGFVENPKARLEECLDRIRKEEEQIADLEQLLGKKEVEIALLKNWLGQRN